MVDDLRLYLDTHPEEKQALQMYHTLMREFPKIRRSIGTEFDKDIKMP